jgi:hypothetical protein
VIRHIKMVKPDQRVILMTGCIDSRTRQVS